MRITCRDRGAFTRPISSSKVDAQHYFDQGFQLMYGFDKYDAIRSFREAEKRAPNCAICYWGEPWAWGAFLNGPMSVDEAPFAFAAAQKAVSCRPIARLTSSGRLSTPCPGVMSSISIRRSGATRTRRTRR